MTTKKEFILSGIKSVKPQIPVGIVGVGSYLPPTVLTNEDFVNVKLSEDGIKFVKEYLGFKERRYAGHESFTEMSIKAAKNALSNSSICPKDIDLVISTHCSRDMARLSPPNSNVIQTAIGADNATSFNVDGGFNGWLNAVITGCSFIGSGYYDTVLVVTAEESIRGSDCTNLKALLLGDGAGAFILRKVDEGDGLLGFHLMAKECVKAARVKIMGAYGNYNDLSYDVRPYVSVDPESMQRDLPLVEQCVPYSVKQSLIAADLDVNDVNLFIFGQQYKKVNETWAYNLGVDYNKVHDTLHKYACMKNASISVNTVDALEEDKIKKGDIIAFGDQGANWSISSAIFRWCI